MEPRSLNKVLEELSKKSEAKQPKFDAREHKDKTRSRIALRVVNWYFILIGLVLVGIPIYNLLVAPNYILDIKDILSSIAGIINGTFGFVVGYYFKGSEKE